MVDKSEETFMDISKESSSNSVWKYFLRGKTNQVAKCMQCKQVLKILGGCTTPMHTHLRSKHNTVLNKRKFDENTTASTSDSNDSVVSTTRKTNTIIDVFKSKKDETFPAVVARMIASDCLPFRVFCTSNDLRKCLTMRGFSDIPKSPTSIQKVVMDYTKKIKQLQIAEINQLKKNLCFSLTLDEWTSSRNRHYMNVNVHGSKNIWNLGLSRINSRFAAENCVKLLEDKLESFQLNIRNDISCIVTDGASMMQKVGRLLPCEQILCFAHAIQIAIVNVIYKQTEKEVDEDDYESVLDLDSDEEDLSDDEGMQVGTRNECDVEITEKFTLRNVIMKVRVIVRMFRRSPLKNEVLQKHVKEDHGKELQLLLDSKTRWSSLMPMLERFNLLKSSIKKAIIDIKADTFLNDSEWNIISTVSRNLKPIKLAVDALCRADANLLSADATFTFVLENFDENEEIGREMKKEFEVQINRRRTVVYNVLQYLHNGGKTKIHKNILRRSKTEITKIIISLIQRLSSEVALEIDPTVSESTKMDDDKPIESLETQLSLQEILQQKIKESLSESRSKVLQKSSIHSEIRSEMKFWDEGRSRGMLLEDLYKSLLTTPPTSVESERAFSAAGAFSTKIRSRLNDKTLDTLCFLKSFFKNQNEN